MFLEPEEIPKQVVSPTINLIPREETMKICLVTLLGLAINFALPVNAQSIQERIALAEIRDLAIKKEAQPLFGDDAVVFVSGNEISVSSTGHFNHRLQHYVENFALQVLWNANYSTLSLIHI